VNPSAPKREHKRYTQNTEPRVKGCLDPDNVPSREKTHKPRRSWQ